MDSDISVLKNIIERRRSVMPSTYNGRAISRETLEAILESANHAPTHKLTQPWHFVVFRGSALEELGAELSNIYRDTTASRKVFRAQDGRDGAKGCFVFGRHCDYHGGSSGVAT
jgi:nitroreductase